MKGMLVILLLLLSTVSPVRASEKSVFKAVVVDAQTHEPLPFASVYVSRTASTITNAEGAFSIKCEPEAALRISYVGYKTVTIQASHLRGSVSMQSLNNLLKEVTVTPIDLKSLIRKTTSELRSQLRKYDSRKSCFFYRQTTFSDSTCFELMEAFLQAKSAVYLRDLFLLNGRFAGIQPDSLHRYSFWTNFFTVSELPMVKRYDSFDNQDAKPLTRNYKDFYDLDYDVMSDNSGRLVAIHFIPKEHITTPILAVTLYIDEQTHRLRKMEGEKRNLTIIHKELVIEQVDTTEIRKWVKSYEPSNFKLTVNMTEERGFLEVQSVYIDEQFRRHGKLFSTRSILFNVGDQTGNKDQQRMWNFGDLHTFIRQQGYDPEFWHNNEVILRTPVEQQVMEMFENQNLFGVYQ